MKQLVGYITIAEAARRLGVSENTVRRQLISNRLAGLQTPIGRLVREKSVDRLVEAKTA